MYTPPPSFPRPPPSPRPPVPPPLPFSLSSLPLTSPYEAYFGINSAASLITDAGLNYDKMLYLEVGGASQQIAWWKSQESHEAGQFARFKATQASKGIVHMAYPNAVVGIKSKYKKQLYAASVLGDGGDRLVAHLVIHALKTRPAVATKVEVPCMPEGLRLTLKTGKKVGSKSGWLQSNGRDTGASGGITDFYKVNSLADVAGDPTVRAFFTKHPTGEIAASGTQSKTQCHTFMKKMFAAEKDEVGGTRKTYADLFEMHRLNYCKDHKAMTMTSVGTVDPAKITANHSVVFNSGVLANERSFIKSKRKANVPFTFAELKEVGENACSGDGRTKIRKDKGSPHLGPSISGYDLPGQCAAITEAVLVRACNVARARVWCSCVCAPPNQI